VEAWAAKQPDKLTLSKAIRQLVKMGLAAVSPAEKVGKAAPAAAEAPSSRKNKS
jgi:hypothetical protein